MNYHEAIINPVLDWRVKGRDYPIDNIDIGLAVAEAERIMASHSSQETKTNTQD